MSSRRALLAAAALSLLPGLARAQPAYPALPISSLRPGDALPAWLKPQVFANQPRHTRFELVRDEGRTVLRALAEASASGLVRTLRIDPRTHPVLVWRWKVANLLEKSDLATRAGDDFPVRLYVTFDLDLATLSFGERLQLSAARAIWGDALPLAALCYVWDTRAPPGTMVPNAYTDRVRMVVVESGPSRLGRWIEYERDVDEDFRRAFGAQTPSIAGLIVSADTDNTGERAESWFGDAEFRPRRPS